MTAVLFDLDGTLIDSLPNVRDAANAVLAKRDLPPLPSEIVAGFVGLGEEVFVDRLIEATDLDAGERDWVMTTFIRHYKEEAKKTKLFHGVEKALTVLQGEGVPLGLVTNKPRGPLGPTLEAAGLTRFFGAVVAGDELPKRKPDPLPIAHATKLLGQTRAIYVGDSETDAATALNAGVPFVLFTEGIRLTPVHDLPHEVAFSDFGMLPEIVRHMIDA